MSLSPQKLNALHSLHSQIAEAGADIQNVADDLAAVAKPLTEGGKRLCEESYGSESGFVSDHIKLAQTFADGLRTARDSIASLLDVVGVDDEDITIVKQSFDERIETLVRVEGTLQDMLGFTAEVPSQVVGEVADIVHRSFGFADGGVVKGSPSLFSGGAHGEFVQPNATQPAYLSGPVNSQGQQIDDAADDGITQEDAAKLFIRLFFGDEANVTAQDVDGVTVFTIRN
jgi:hypothetical protein